MSELKDKKKIFTYNLKNERLKNGFTQEQLANRLHVCRTTYSSYECGVSDPNIYMLLDLCSILDINITNLFDEP